MAFTPRASWRSTSSRRKRVRRRRFDAHLVRLPQRGPVVDGPAQAVEDPAEEAFAHVDGQGTAEGLDGVAVADTGQVAEGHAGQGGALDGDHLGVEDPAPAPDPDRFAHGGGDAFDLDAQSHQPGDPAGAPGGHGGAQRRVQRVGDDGHGGPPGPGRRR